LGLSDPLLQSAQNAQQSLKHSFLDPLHQDVSFAEAQAIGFLAAQVPFWMALPIHLPLDGHPGASEVCGYVAR